MNFKKPKFWDNAGLSLWSVILYPFSIILLLSLSLIKFFKIEKKFPIPIICVGNIYLGGTGKTPLALEKFRNNNLNQFIEIEGLNYLYKIKKNNDKVVFISGHFNNFELMAMEIEKAGIDLCTIYRPLNNPFLNIIMENIRKKYICRNQIKKGMGGTRDLINLFKKNFSVALMIDQRVSEGEEIDFFDRNSKTTTIPAQLVKKYGCNIVPVYIERVKNFHFKLYFYKPIKFDENLSQKQITFELNKILEKMILKNPDQWIWTHDRWK